MSILKLNNNCPLNFEFYLGCSSETCKVYLIYMKHSNVKTFNVVSQT